MKLLPLILLYFLTSLVYSQTIDVNSTLGLPRVTTTAAFPNVDDLIINEDLIGDTNVGNLVYNTTDDLIYRFDGTNWIALANEQDDDWFIANTTDIPTSINQDIYTLGDIGIGTDDPQRAIHLAGNNSVLRVSRSNNSAAFIFDRYDGAINNTLKSFFFGLNASAAGVGEFFLADYNENVAGGGFTRIMTFTDGNDPIKFDQYGVGNFDNNAPARLLGVEANGDVVEVVPSTITSPNLVVLNAYLGFNQFVRNNNLNNIRFEEIEVNLGGFPNPLGGTNGGGIDNRNTQIEIPENGLYEISYAATIDSTSGNNQDRDYEANLSLNGTIIPGSKSIVTLSENESRIGNVSNSVIRQLNQNDIIRVTIQRNIGTGNYIIVEDSGSVIVKKID